MKQQPTFYKPVWKHLSHELVLRPDTPRYYVVWYEGKKLKKRSTRTEDLEKAQQFLIDMVHSSDRRSVPDPHNVQIEDVIGYYLEKKLTPSSPSWKNTVEMLIPLRAFFRAHQLTRVDHLEPDVMDLYPEFRDELYAQNQIRRYLSYRKYQGCRPDDLKHKIKPISDGTIARELSILNAALRFYKKRRKITDVPFIQMPPPPPARSRWLTPDEYQRLYANADSENLRDFMELMIRTLQRPGFLLDLELDQIDLPRRRISFLKRGQRQTRKRRPDVRISEMLVPLLRRRMAQSASGYLLEKHGQPITNLLTPFRQAASRAGLHDVDDPDCERVIPYTLRHTGATWLAQSGVDLWQIAGMLGHKDTRMVERVYAKHHPDFQQKAVETLDALVPASRDRCASHAPDSDSVLFRHSGTRSAKLLIPLRNQMVGGKELESLTSTMSMCRTVHKV